MELKPKPEGCHIRLVSDIKIRKVKANTTKNIYEKLLKDANEIHNNNSMINAVSRINIDTTFDFYAKDLVKADKIIVFVFKITFGNHSWK